MRLDGKNAIVTGAASGIGAAIASLYVAEGARVTIADVQMDKAEAVARALGFAAQAIEHDVSSNVSWERLVNCAEQHGGAVSILVNNAGIAGSQKRIEDMSEADFRRVVDVNQVGVFLGMRGILPSMRRANGGSIINTSSVYGLVGASRQVDYCASKFAITGMTKAAALELGVDNIRVNCVHPGATNTPMITGSLNELDLDAEQFVSAFAIKRWADPTELAQVYVFLASDEASFCTGASVAVDGGLTAA